MHEFAELSVPSGSVGIHWFGQNSYALKDSQGTITLIDPYFPHERPAERFIRPDPPLNESGLPTHYVVLTHSHLDHTNAETIGRIHAAWPQAVYIGPQDSIDKVVGKTSVDAGNTVPISAAESVAREGITIHAVYGKPPEGDHTADIQPPDVTHLGYVLEIEGIRLYFSGDVIRTFADHDDLVKPVAALHPDIGFLTTHPTEGEFPFFDGSVAMAKRTGLKTVVPSHYDCFVKRTYDPNEWAKSFPAEGPTPLIIPWNSHIIYP